MVPTCLLFYVYHFVFLFFCADFRTPKPDIGYSTEKNTLDRNKENSLLLTDSDSKDAPSKINEAQIGLTDMAAVKSVLLGINIFTIYSTG